MFYFTYKSEKTLFTVANIIVISIGIYSVKFTFSCVFFQFLERVRATLRGLAGHRLVATGLEQVGHSGCLA